MSYHYSNHDLIYKILIKVGSLVYNLETYDEYYNKSIVNFNKIVDNVKTKYNSIIDSTYSFTLLCYIELFFYILEETCKIKSLNSDYQFNKFHSSLVIEKQFDGHEFLNNIKLNKEIQNIIKNNMILYFSKEENNIVINDFDYIINLINYPDLSNYLDIHKKKQLDLFNKSIKSYLYNQ